MWSSDPGRFNRLNRPDPVEDQLALRRRAEASCREIELDRIERIARRDGLMPATDPLSRSIQLDGEEQEILAAQRMADDEADLRRRAARVRRCGP